MTKEELIQLKERTPSHTTTSNPHTGANTHMHIADNPHTTDTTGITTKSAHTHTSDHDVRSRTAHKVSHMIAHTIDTMCANLDRLVGDMNPKEAINFVRELQELRHVELTLLKCPNE
jgi:hypothetical protein